MKPLSIEELKNLIIGTWVYLTDKDGYLGRYVVKAEAPIEEDEKTFNFDSLSGSWTYNYRYYGTKWLAFKNKEQAECKCISYKFPCELGTTIYYIKKQCRDFFNDFDDNYQNFNNDHNNYYPQDFGNENEFNRFKENHNNMNNRCHRPCPPCQRPQQNCCNRNACCLLAGCLFGRCCCRR